MELDFNLQGSQAPLLCGENSLARASELLCDFLVGQCGLDPHQHNVLLVATFDVEAAFVSLRKTVRKLGLQEALAVLFYVKKHEDSVGGDRFINFVSIVP